MPFMNFSPITLNLDTNFNPVDFDSDDIEIPEAPKIPRSFTPKAEDKYISYVLEMEDYNPHLQIKNLPDNLNWLFWTKLSGYFPELLFAKKNIWEMNSKWIEKREIGSDIFSKKEFIKNKNFIEINPNLEKEKYPDLPIEIEPLFPYPAGQRNYKNANKFGLHKFILITLPIFQRQYERKVSKTKFNAVMHEITYLLKDMLRLKSCYPSTPYKGYKLLSSTTSSANQTCTSDDDWHIEKINARRIQRPSNIDGNGVVIGHPDSGWTPHESLNFENIDVDPVSNNFDLSRDWNVFNDSDTAEEPLNNEAVTNFHGTATSSMIIGKKDISGVSTGATIISVRCISDESSPSNYAGVILIFDIDVARAIWKLIQDNVDIISISLGGLPMPALECVIAHAVYNNIIVVAAAGNYVKPVVFPARYPECMAIGASNINNRPWSESSEGSKVAFSAPGEGVCCANWGNSSPNPRPIINKSDGTSFSTAITAGVAALWLQRYGKQSLVNGLGGDYTLQELFQAHVEATVTIPSNWNTALNGAGIINVQNLLNMGTLQAIIPTLEKKDWNNWKRRSNMELFYSMFESSDPVIAKERAEQLFNIVDIVTFMEEYGQEVLNILGEIPEAADKINDAINETADDAVEILEDTVEIIVDVASDPIGTVTGWFS